MMRVIGGPRSSRMIRGPHFSRIVIVAGITLVVLASRAGDVRAQEAHPHHADSTRQAGSHAHAGMHTSPYAGEIDREIKALSDQQTQDYLSGAGMGLAQVAELNHYPGPRHVLDLADELRLSDEQVQATQTIFERMSSEAKRLGRAIVEQEAMLDARFRDGSAEEAEVRALMDEIGRLESQLRFTHVRAHLQMREILSDEQVSSYDRLRGYVRAHQTKD